MAIWNYCRSLSQPGCGYYPNSVFVHVDVREHHGQWVDWSSPGKRPRYGTLRRAYRKRERRNPKRKRVGRHVSRPLELPLVVEVIDRRDAVVRVFDEQPKPDTADPAASAVAEAASEAPQPVGEHEVHDPGDPLSAEEESAVGQAGTSTPGAPGPSSGAPLGDASETDAPAPAPQAPEPAAPSAT